MNGRAFSRVTLIAAASTSACREAISGRLVSATASGRRDRGPDQAA